MAFWLINPSSGSKIPCIERWKVMRPLVILLSLPLSVQYHVLRRRILSIRPYEALRPLHPLHSPSLPRDIYNYCHEHLSVTHSSEQRTHYPISSPCINKKTRYAQSNTHNLTTINLLKHFYQTKTSKCLSALAAATRWSRPEPQNPHS
jgi:hypothetical protein